MNATASGIEAEIIETETDDMTNTMTESPATVMRVIEIPGMCEMLETHFTVKGKETIEILVIEISGTHGTYASHAISETEILEICVTQETVGMYATFVTETAGNHTCLDDRIHDQTHGLMHGPSGESLP